jgi:hypothetical protein
MKITKFEAGRNAGTKVCRLCGKRTWMSKGGCDLCQGCYDAAGLENEHADGYHQDEPHPSCPACQG